MKTQFIMVISQITPFQSVLFFLKVLSIDKHKQTQGTDGLHTVRSSESQAVASHPDPVWSTLSNVAESLEAMRDG